MKYSLKTLAAILAQIVQFSRDDYFNGKDAPDYPQDIGWNVAYICCCFIAQHTEQGSEGVDTEVAYVGLKVMEHMSYEDRLKLAEQLVSEWGGAIDQ
jgi:hypothetical protein